MEIRLVWVWRVGGMGLLVAAPQMVSLRYVWAAEMGRVERRWLADGDFSKGGGSGSEAEGCECVRCGGWGLGLASWVV